jgi:endonuclease/exonuclease/phosphatase (EEP) superfamily protein YafD
VAGDFNEDRDGRAVGFLVARGMQSALPEFVPHAKTWRWDTSLGQVHSRLDHIVYNRQLVPTDAHVVDGGRSDHLPVVATFELAAHATR